MNFIVEKDLPQLVNLRPLYLSEPSVREVYTPMVYKLGVNDYITELRGARISLGSIEEISSKIECPEDILEFILRGETCFIPNPAVFIPLFVKSLDESQIISLETGGIRDYPIGEYSVTLGRASLLVRKGNRFGRLFSFWEAFPKHFIEERLLDKYDLSSLSLEDFFQVFGEVLKECFYSGLSLSTFHSPASIISALFQGSKSRKMFGHLDSIEPLHIERAHQSYKGSIFESGDCGYSDGYYYDINFAYPSVIGTLTPCYPPYMEWVDSKEYQSNAFYASILCKVTPSETDRYAPVSLRYWTSFGYRLGSFQVPQVLWITLPEYKFLIGGGVKVQILKGSWGVPLRYETPLKGTMDSLYELRENRTVGRLVKSATQSIAGKMGSKWAEDNLILSVNSGTGAPEFTIEHITRASPIYQIIYSSHINGSIRAEINFYRLRFNALTSRADGIITPKEIPSNYLSSKPGGLRLKEVGRMGIIDDIICDTPKSPRRLEEILVTSDPKRDSYPILEKRVVSVMEALRVKKSKDWKDSIGTVVVRSQDRRIGSHKMISKNGNSSLEAFNKYGLSYRPVRTGAEFLEIRTKRRGYDGYS